MMFYLRRQVWEGLIVAGLGAGVLALIPSQVDSILSTQRKLSPSFIPVLIGISLIAVGLLIAGLSFFGKIRDMSKGVEKNEFVRVLFSVLLLLSYTILFPVIGFITTSAIFIGIFSFMFGQRSPLKLGAVMIVIPVLVWMLFELIFVIPLPHGLLF